MYITSTLDRLPADFIHGCVATIGNFDGVHLGHQQLVGQTVQQARDMNLPSAVITFEPHPLRVMLGDAAPPLLMPLSRKLACIGAQGVDLALVLPFTREIAATSPEEFVDSVLIGALHTRMLLVGYDYAFGKGRRGNATLLAKLGAQHSKASGAEQGFRVEQIPPVFAEGGIVSSTRIREDIQTGNVDEAARLLGRPHSVEGIVAHGMNRGGALLGFPTANLHIEENLLLPQIGVYAVLAEVGAKGGTLPGFACAAGQPEGILLRGVASVGKNPTFGDKDLRVETHLLDFQADIYGAPLRAHFIHRLRDERKFADIDALKEQIRRDTLQARDILS